MARAAWHITCTHDGEHQGQGVGARLQVRLSDIDDITLDITGHLLSVLDAHDPMGTDANEAPEEDDDNAAGPLAIAVDVNEDPSTEATVS
jgi:exoribonuclease-2